MGPIRGGLIGTEAEMDGRAAGSACCGLSDVRRNSPENGGTADVFFKTGVHFSKITL